MSSFRPCRCNAGSPTVSIGDAKLESACRADKIEGKVQNAIGGLKDTLKGK